MPGPAPAVPPVSPAAAARLRQLAAHAEHRRAIAEFHARHAADQQACINALLLEAIAALATLFSESGRTGNHPSLSPRSRQPRPPADGAVITKACQNVHTEPVRPADQLLLGTPSWR